MLLKTLSVAAAIVFCAASVSATTYDYAYTFNTGDTVTGSFTGTAGGGGLITDIGHVTGSIDGTALAGPLVAHGYTGYHGPSGGNCGDASCFTGSAVASADPTKNNFLFANYSAQADFPGTNYFYIIPWTNGGNNQVATQALLADGTQIDHYNGQYIAGNWSLTAVPEPTSWAMLAAGFALVGVAARRRSAVAA